MISTPFFAWVVSKPQINESSLEIDNRSEWVLGQLVIGQQLIFEEPILKNEQSVKDKVVENRTDILWNHLLLVQILDILDDLLD